MQVKQIRCVYLLNRTKTLVVDKKRMKKKYLKSILISKTHSFTVLFQSKSTHNFTDMNTAPILPLKRAFFSSCLQSKMHWPQHCICQISHTNAEHTVSTVHTIHKRNLELLYLYEAAIIYFINNVPISRR